MITADTITDEQIRELRSRLGDRFDRGIDTREDRLAYLECEVALFDLHSVDADTRRGKARARCAEILNARDGGGIAMICPTCHADTRVTETRTTSLGLRRRRICMRVECGKRFTTYEVMAPHGTRCGDGARFVVVSDTAIAALRLAAQVTDELFPSAVVTAYPEPLAPTAIDEQELTA